MDTRLIFLDIDGTFIEPGRMEASGPPAQTATRSFSAPAAITR